MSLHGPVNSRNVTVPTWLLENWLQISDHRWHGRKQHASTQTFQNLLHYLTPAESLRHLLTPTTRQTWAMPNTATKMSSLFVISRYFTLHTILILVVSGLIIYFIFELYKYPTSYHYLTFEIATPSPADFFLTKMSVIFYSCTWK